MLARAHRTPSHARVRPRLSAVQMRGELELTTKSVYEVTADLVGFFCGASLSTLSLYPHHDAVAVPARPRRWNQRY